MSSFIITGGRPLKGTVQVAGNKNAALPVLAATVLTDQPSVIENVPDIADVHYQIQLLQSLGAQVKKVSPHTIQIDPAGIKNPHLDPQLVAKIRASILFLGPLLARFGQVKLRHPGGCMIGRRPVGTHFQAIRDLGGDVVVQGENYLGNFKKRKSNHIFLNEASVTATENLLMLAAGIPGTTIIEDAACEPHVQNLAEYLAKMGTQISGIGSNRLEVTGTKNLKGATHTLCPDFMEAGTFAIMAAAAKSHLIIKGARQQDFPMIGHYLQEFGVKLKFTDDQTLEVLPSQLHAPTNLKEIQTRPWPGFPPEVMSPLLVLGTQCSGTTLFHDWMYESRMFFADKLITMGAHATVCDPHRLLITGPTPLRGKQLESPDVRAGMALVIAALIAQGESQIHRAEIIGRGYQNLAKRLQTLGAHIKEVQD